MDQHAAEKFWWGDVAKTANMAFRTREQALWAEWAVITTCHPLYNLRAPLPKNHQCPEAPAPPLPFDGFISVMESLQKVKANQPKYAEMHQRISGMFADAGVGPLSPYVSAFDLPLTN